MKSEPFERVTLKMLRYFYEVAQTKHFTKAAENLNITNSPLSNRIKELEEVLNVKLFERDSRNVMLTEAGRLLESKCQLIFQTLDVSLNQVQQVGLNQRNILRVGVVSSAFWADLIVCYSASMLSMTLITPTFLTLTQRRKRSTLARRKSMWALCVLLMHSTFIRISRYLWAKMCLWWRCRSNMS